MAINSRQKGKRGEREWARFLTEKGFPARRGAQYSGLDIHKDYAAPSPDIVCKKLDLLHFEVKWVEALNIYNAIQQARNDAGERFAVVAHRRNHSEWLVTMPAEHFIALLQTKT